MRDQNKSRHLDPTFNTEQGSALVIFAVGILLIGLAVGTSVLFKEIFKSANLRKMTAQLNEYGTAVRTYKIKYIGFPGDFGKAEQFGLSEGDCPRNGKGCNGNGNNILEDEWKGQYLFNGEIPGFWFQLTKLELINEKRRMDGVSNKIGIGFPRFRVKHTGIHSYYSSEMAGHPFHIGAADGDIDPPNMRFANALTPDEAFMLDDKLDDGLPLIGKARAKGGLEGDEPPVTGPVGSDSCVANGHYNLSFSGDACQLLVKIE